jgi:hypothetical protein
MIDLTKHTIKGKIGSTVVYRLANLRFDESDNKLKWDSFRFYTPLGNRVDEKGYKFFAVPADEIPIERDDILDKELAVIITEKNGVEAVEIFEDAENETISIGLEGDIVVTGFIPADPQKEIELHYKEVTHG